MLTDAQKIPVKKYRGRKVKHVRKATNEELMHASLQRKGEIAVRISFQIYGLDHQVYGLKGKSISFRVTSIRDVEKTIGAIDKLIRSFQQ